MTKAYREFVEAVNDGTSGSQIRAAAAAWGRELLEDVHGDSVTDSEARLAGFGALAGHIAHANRDRIFTQTHYATPRGRRAIEDQVLEGTREADVAAVVEDAKSRDKCDARSERYVDRDCTLAAGHEGAHVDCHDVRWEA